MSFKTASKERVAALGVDLLDLNEALIQNGKQFNEWGSLIDENVFKVDSLVEKIKSGSGAFADFDNLGLESLKLRQKREGEVLDAEIASYAKRADEAGKVHNFVDIETFTYARLTAERRKGIKAIEDEAEKTAFLAQTTKGLEETLKKLLSGDKVSVDLVKKDAGDSFLRERISLAKENIALDQKYYADSEYLAQLDANKKLNFERKVFEVRKELSEKGDFSKTESDVKVLDYVNSQVKGLSDTFADFRIGLAGNFFDAVTAPFDALKDKLKGLNPIARGLATTFIDLGRDIVKAFSSKIILRLLGLDSGTGAGGSGNSGGGFDIGGFIKNLLGGRSAGNGNSGGSYPGTGVGVYTTPPFAGFSGSGSGRNQFAADFGFGASSGTTSNANPFAAFLGNYRPDTNALNAGLPTGAINAAGQVVVNGAGGGSHGLSSIFGSKGFGNNVGTYGAIGSLAAIGGGLIGGRVGGFLSGAGSGLALGAQIGSIVPGIGTAIGAGVGAIAGGLISLLGGDPKKKKDKKEGLPALNKGFVDAFAQLNQILIDSNALKFHPPEEAATKADGIYSEISNGFGIVFESKKYKAEAKNLIEQKKKEADVLRAQIKKSAAGAQSAAEFSNKFVATFATGGYTDGAFMNQYGGFKREYGLLKGGIPGKDSIPVLAMEKELFLTEQHQRDIIRGAGYDVFDAHARIPNYPKRVSDYRDAAKIPLRMATGGFIGNSSANVSGSSAAPVMNFNGNIVLQGFTATADAKAYLETPDGKRQVINVVRENIQTNNTNSDGLARDIKKADRN